MNVSLSVQSSRRQSGMTLVELLIALALSLAVLIGLSAVYVAVKQSFRFQDNTGRLQEDATFALDSISRDLRMAGFAGCAGIQKVVVGGATPTTTYYPGSVLSPINPAGISALNPLSTVVSSTDTNYAEISQQPFTSFNILRGFDNVPSAMFATAPTSPTTDSLFFSGGSSSSVGISTAMALADSTVTIGSDPYGWKNSTYDMIISDCNSSSLFKGKVNAAGTSITHDSILGNGGDNFQSDHLYGTDASVMLAQWNFYYVATRTGATTPSLYRVFYDGKTRKDAEEVISNVESMKLHYGENTNVGTANLQADTWRTTAAAVTDWSRVVAVRVGLMVVSADDSISPDIALTVPTLLGTTYTVPTGASTKRLRKEFSTTVVLRNSVKAR